MINEQQAVQAQSYVEQLQQRAVTLMAQGRAAERELAAAGGRAENAVVSIEVSAAGSVTSLEFSDSVSRIAQTEVPRLVMEAYAQAVMQANQATAATVDQISPALFQGIRSSVPEDVQLTAATADERNRR